LGTTAFADILARYPRIGAAPVARKVVGGFSGGEVWRIDSEGASHALRRWPDGTRPSRVDEVHSVLTALASRSGLPIAAPLAARDGSRWTWWGGDIWELTRWLPGEPPRSRTTNPALVAAAMRGLAAFHSAARGLTPPAFGESPSIVERRGLARDGIAWNASTFERAVATARDPQLAPRAERVRNAAPPWLPVVRADLDGAHAGPLHWILRDVWRSNLLFEGERLSGWIDFDAMRIDSPSADIARLLGSLASDRPTWQEGLSAYRESVALGADDARRILAFQRSGVLFSAINWLRWLVAERRTFDDRAAAIRRWDEWIGDLEAGPAAFAWIGDRAGW